MKYKQVVLVQNICFRTLLILGPSKVQNWGRYNFESGTVPQILTPRIVKGAIS